MTKKETEITLKYQSDRIAFLETMLVLIEDRIKVLERRTNPHGSKG